MPSCSNSSNIRSSFNAITVTNSGGSRLLISIPTATGLTAGQVIRYDVAAAGYTTSKANDAATSEVFGVVESYDSSSSSLNVVIYGSINLNSSYLADMGSGGGCGGNDIYFLSGKTSGVLQNLAPSETNYIIKPVYQAAPHGTYTGIVMNYLGYRIGGDVQATIVETEPLGNIVYVLGANPVFEDGVVDASISHQLPISSYSEFYQKFGLSYGYVERLGITGGSIPVSVRIGDNVTQTNNSTYSGQVAGIDFDNKYLSIYRPPDGVRASLNQTLQVVTQNSTVNLALYSTDVYATLTPIVQSASEFNITTRSGLDVTPSQTVKIGLKVKPKGVQVSIPDTITVTNLIAAGISLAGQDLETRIDALES